MKRTRIVTLALILVLLLGTAIAAVAVFSTPSDNGEAALPENNIQVPIGGYNVELEDVSYSGGAMDGGVGYAYLDIHPADGTTVGSASGFPIKGWACFTGTDYYVVGIFMSWDAYSTAAPKVQISHSTTGRSDLAAYGNYAYFGETWLTIEAFAQQADQNLPLASALGQHTLYVWAMRNDYQAAGLLGSFTINVTCSHTSTTYGGTAGVHTKCATCGATTSDSHSYSSSVSQTPSCTAAGTTKYTCACGYSYTSNNIDALGHDYSVNSGVEYQKATCTTNRYNYKQCSRCSTNPQSASYIIEIANTATGHATPTVWTTVDTTRYKDCSNNCGARMATQYYLTLIAGTGIASVSGSNADGWYDSGGTATISCTVSTGYSFSNWTGTATLADSSTAVKMDAAKSYTANATAIVYTITYHLDGGTNYDGAPTSYTIESPTITLGTPTKAGSTFGGWYTDAALTAAATSIPQGSTGDKVFYVKWNAAGMTVIYAVIGGTGGTLSSEGETVTADASQGSTPTAATGYHFVGWFTDDAGTNSVDAQLIGEGNKLTPVYDADTTEVTYYAKFALTFKTMVLSPALSGEGTFKDGETFIFTVNIVPLAEGLSKASVTVAGDADGTASIDLPLGEYTITVQNSWSWRYEAAEVSGTLTDASADETTVTVTFVASNDNWANGYDAMLALPESKQSMAVLLDESKKYFL